MRVVWKLWQHIFRPAMVSRIISKSTINRKLLENIWITDVSFFTIFIFQKKKKSFLNDLMFFVTYNNTFNILIRQNKKVEDIIVAFTCNKVKLLWSEWHTPPNPHLCLLLAFSSLVTSN